MGSGLSDYWRERQRHDREQKVIRDLHFFVRCLIDNKIAPWKMLQDVKKMMRQIDEQ